MVRGPVGEPPYDWVDTREAADRLGLTLRTLYCRIDREGLPAYRIGRVYRLRGHEVDAWANGEPPTPAPPTPVWSGPAVDLIPLEAAEYLGLSEWAFRRIARTRVIPFAITSQHGWRFTIADLDTWLEEHARIRPGELGHLWDRIVPGQYRTSYTPREHSSQR